MTAFDLTLPLSVLFIVCCVFVFCKQGSKEHDSVTNRVAGFICKHVFTEHSSCVTGLAVVGREAGYNTTYLVRLICNVKYGTMLKGTVSRVAHARLSALGALAQ